MKHKRLKVKSKHEYRVDGMENTPANKKDKNPTQQSALSKGQEAAHSALASVRVWRPPCLVPSAPLSFDLFFVSLSLHSVPKQLMSFLGCPKKRSRTPEQRDTVSAPAGSSAETLAGEATLDACEASSGARAGSTAEAAWKWEARAGGTARRVLVAPPE